MNCVICYSLDFLYYYPRKLGMGMCQSFPSSGSWTSFIGQLLQLFNFNNICFNYNELNK
jgi:hypothetical protein